MVSLSRLDHGSKIVASSAKAKAYATFLSNVEEEEEPTTPNIELELGTPNIFAPCSFHISR
jgi:hypothetical protein